MSAAKPPKDDRSSRPEPESDEANQGFRDFDSRLTAFRERGQKSSVWAERFRRAPSSGLGLAFRVSVEVVSALAVGVGIGWLLDEWLGTRPWLMLVFIVLGGAAGILNVVRLASGYGYDAGYRAKGDNVTGEGEEKHDRRSDEEGSRG